MEPSARWRGGTALPLRHNRRVSAADAICPNQSLYQIDVLHAEPQWRAKPIAALSKAVS